MLANIMLDDLDRELTSRGHRFCRYADDCNVYVRSQRAGERVMASIRRFVEGRLGLKVNEQKSAVDRPWKLKFLGFQVGGRKGASRIGLASQTIQRFKVKVREITARSNGQSMQWRIKRLNAYQRGWLGYFALAATPRVYADLDGWVRHRLRACLWKQWKRIRTRQRELRALGLPDWTADGWANTRKGIWRMAGGPMNRALNTAYWRHQGLQSLTERFGELSAS
ncbi:MAG TPA: group II intron maturase-specific domain-containing protein [Thermoanaerobaculaceae bacterium]|nr:group II intron maturase-specific domain-containing protein [Thermoanaerobaculaceae bacterium]